MTMAHETNAEYHIRIEAERKRYKAALEDIERRVDHQGCYRCGPCLAHMALHGHWYSNWGRCCYAIPGQVLSGHQ